MLYTVPFVKDSDDYLRRFREIQPQLRSTIHGLSHPPGASLSLYWIGNALGARGLDIRQPETRLRYTLGLTLFGLAMIGSVSVYQSYQLTLAKAAVPSNSFYLWRSFVHVVTALTTMGLTSMIPYHFWERHARTLFLLNLILLMALFLVTLSRVMLR